MVTNTSAPDVEAPLRAAFTQGDFQTAAQLSIDLYGAELQSFLCVRLRSEDHAEEAFSMFAEDVCAGIASFAWRCSLRCWLYVLARNAANRFVSSPEHRRDRNLPLSQYASLLVARQTARTKTAPHHDSELTRRVRALRERLTHADQMLLILHVDRRLSWRELALVMNEQGEALEGESLEREAARLRKRFERVKVQLKRLAQDEGLLPR